MENINRIKDKNTGTRIRLSKIQKGVGLIISITLTLFIIYFWLFTSRSFNYRDASIEKQKSDFIITTFGKRSLMAHDPISFLENNTYEDSIKFEVPKYQGIINASDVLAMGTYFKFIKGNITINVKSMKIDLYYISAYNKTLEALEWNGTYTLNWR